MKNTIRNLTGVTVLGLLTFTALAGYAADSTSSASSMMDAPPPSQLHPYTVGVQIGTLGPGATVSWRFQDHFGVGAGFNYFSYSMNNRKIKDDTYNAKLRLMSEPLTLDWYPWETSSFHVSVGGLFNQNHITGSGTGTLTVNGTTYVGTVNLDIKPQPVDPYLGIGWNVYLTKSHHWSLAGTLGVLYQGDAKVSLSSVPADPTGTVAAEQAVVQKYANDLKVYPVLELGLNYSF
jgi:hypothetical protein